MDKPFFYNYLPSICNAVQFGDGCTSSHFCVSGWDDYTGCQIGSIGVLATAAAWSVAHHQPHSAALLLLAQLRVGDVSPACREEREKPSD